MDAAAGDVPRAGEELRARGARGDPVLAVVRAEPASRQTEVGVGRVRGCFRAREEADDPWVGRVADVEYPRKADRLPAVGLDGLGHADHEVPQLRMRSVGNERQHGVVRDTARRLLVVEKLRGRLGFRDVREVVDDEPVGAVAAVAVPSAVLDPLRDGRGGMRAVPGRVVSGEPVLLVIGFFTLALALDPEPRHFLDVGRVRQVHDHHPGTGGALGVLEEELVVPPCGEVRVLSAVVEVHVRAPAGGAGAEFVEQRGLGRIRDVPGANAAEPRVGLRPGGHLLVVLPSGVRR